MGIESGETFGVKIGEPLKEESNIGCKIELADHSKSFRIGEQLSFSSKEAYEIGWSLQMVARKYLNQINAKILERDEQE